MNKPERERALLLCEAAVGAARHTALGEHVWHKFTRIDRGMSWSKFIFSCETCGTERVYGGGEA